MKRNLAIIPARGGSKRIPRKNIRDFQGRPMISYAISAAISSGVFDSVIVSTDDDEIARISAKYGATVPFMRESRLSDDVTGTLPVIQNVVSKLLASGINYDLVTCIYPTVPLLRASDLVKAFDQFQSSGCGAFLIASHRFEYPVQRGFYYQESTGLVMLFPDEYNTRSQDLPVVYHDAGQFYVASTETWLTAERIYTNDSELFIIERQRSIDIDTPEDWKEAEHKAALLNLSI
jgi:pseudaminic acid cytidylyltransferase